MRTVVALLLALSASCAASGDAPGARPEGTSAASAPRDLGLRPVSAPLVLTEPTVTLAWLLDELARLTGQEIACDPDLRAQLEAEKETLESVASVPADEVYPFVESLVGYRGFALTVLKEGEPTMLGVIGRSRNAAVPWATVSHVALVATDVAAIGRHPALLVQFTMHFENLDTRQLQTQLRQLLADPSGMCNLVPAGERSLILQGPGAKLSGLIQLLREIDAVSAARVPAQTQAEQAAAPR